MKEMVLLTYIKLFRMKKKQGSKWELISLQKNYLSLLKVLDGNNRYRKVCNNLKMVL